MPFPVPYNCTKFPTYFSYKYIVQNICLYFPLGYRIIHSLNFTQTTYRCSVYYDDGVQNLVLMEN